MYEPRRLCRRGGGAWRLGGVCGVVELWRLPHMVIVDMLVWLRALVMIIILLSEPETCL